MSSIKHHVTGQQYWRSLEQLAESPEVADLLGQEFPGYDADDIAHSSRRGFMKLMGAAMALAGITLTGCRRWPKEELAPYAANPRGIVPGVPLRYATSWELGGVGRALLVTAYDGRPIKVEGNPDHPASATAKGAYGSADAFSQATILEMYDPQRSRSVIDRTNKAAGGERHTDWNTWKNAFAPILSDLKKAGGEGLAILSEATSSPSVLAQREAFHQNFPKAKWYEYEALSRDNEVAGAIAAFGKPLRQVLRLNKADVVVSFDADLLGTHPNHTRYSNDWSQKRRSADVDKTMNRVYVAESGLTTSGSVADVRMGIAPDRVYPLVRALAAKLGVAGVSGGELSDKSESDFVEKAAADIQSANGKAVVVVGEIADPAAIALSHAINVALQKAGKLGADDKPVIYVEPAGSEEPTGTLGDLVSAIGTKDSAGGPAVKALLILGGNPVYDAPADLKFPAALAAVPTSIHLSLYDNETSQAASWHLPRAHYLECWGDCRTWDGTVTLQQPIILPLYDGKSVLEILALVNGDDKTAANDLVFANLLKLSRERHKSAFPAKYRKMLHDGFSDKMVYAEADGVTVNPAVATAPALAAAASGFTLRFAADSHVYDGRFANNGWLQETPDPLTKLMWDNALVIGVRDAKELGLSLGDLVNVTLPDGGKIALPAYILPGQPAKVATVALGYGRTAAGHVGDNVGFNVYSLRTTKNPWSIPGVALTRGGGAYELVTSNEHHILSNLAHEAEEYRLGEKFKNGKIIREATLDDYKANPKDLGGVVRKVALQLFNPPVTDNFRDVHAWGMSIDLTACIGCNSCAVACQAENNIPVVGKDQAHKHREMNWIRIDRYFKGEMEDENPEVVFQPMMCQHCENAPCEQVCPVAATVHDSEGLNTMVYNRCIGTRYCSNNCPYKVRRFNYFDYHAQDPRTGVEWLRVPWPNIPDLQQRSQTQYDPIKRMAFNPEVTVRMRGVMEKCTYCVQRIHTTVTSRRTQGKDIVDGEIVTACQQACPTQAIVFGNLNDAGAKVSALHKNPRAYDVLQEELNTKPRTRYLAKLRNPVA